MCSGQIWLEEIYNFIFQSFVDFVIADKELWTYV